MITKFNESKRMMLLKGSKVKCKKDILINELLVGYTLYPYGDNKPVLTKASDIVFQSGKEYEVSQINSVRDAYGHLHTFDISYFREHFTECSNASISK